MTTRAVVSLAVVMTFCAVFVLGCGSFFVDDSNIISVTLTPATASLQVASSQQYTATGTQAGGGSRDVTGTASWSTGSAAIATINAAGLATTIAPGSTTVTATLNGVSGSTSLTVTGSALLSITLSPTDPSVQAGNTQQFTATGHFADSSTRDISGAVTWTSSNTNSATISSTGLARGVTSGTNTTIGATLGSVSTSTTLTVS